VRARGGPLLSSTIIELRSGPPIGTGQAEMTSATTYGTHSGLGIAAALVRTAVRGILRLTCASFAQQRRRRRCPFKAERPGLLESGSGRPIEEIR
jgi:hypothetical protein